LLNKRILLLASGIGISLLALWIALQGTDLRLSLARVAGADIRWLLLLLVLYGGHFWLKAMRWQLILRPVVQVTIRQAWPPMMLGFFANNILPAHLGEFVRMFAGARQFNMSSTQVLASLLLERLLDLAAVLSILGVLLITGSQLSSTFSNLGYGILILVITGFLIAILYALQGRFVARLVSLCLFFLSPGLRTRVLGHVESGAEGLVAILKPGLFLKIALLSIGQWLLMGLIIQLAFMSIETVVDLGVAFLTLVATVFAVTLPSSPGFFGSIQAAFVVAASSADVPRDVALSASIVFHLATWLFVNVVGLVALQRLGMSWSDLRSKIDQASGEAL
jgi:glycosyltransferase 2 family protein